MTSEELAELEALQKMVDAGNEQLRHTFEMYMTLLDRVNGKEVVKDEQ